MITLHIAGLFAQKYKGLELVSEAGLFYGGSGNLLLYNVTAVFATTGWTVMVTTALVSKMITKMCKVMTRH